MQQGVNSLFATLEQIGEQQNVSTRSYTSIPVESLQDHIFQSKANAESFVVVTQSPYTGKTELLHRTGHKTPLIYIPCHHNRFLIHFRESIESQRIQFQESGESDQITFKKQLDKQEIVYHKIRSYLLCYLQLSEYFMEYNKAKTLCDIGKTYSQNANKSNLHLFYSTTRSIPVESLLIQMYNKFILETQKSIEQKLSTNLQKLKYPIIAIDDAHYLYKQATGLLFHENYKDCIDNFSDIIKCCKYEVQNGICLPSHSISDENFHYKYPTDVLFGFITILKNLKKKHKQNNFNFILSSCDLNILSPYPTIIPFYNLTYYKGIEYTEGVEDEILIRLISEISTKKLRNEISNTSISKLNSDSERLQEVTAILYNSSLLHAGNIEDCEIAPILVRSGIGLWEGNNKIKLHENLIQKFLVRTTTKTLKQLPVDILDIYLAKLLRNSYETDNGSDDSNLLFQSLVIQSVISQFYHSCNGKSLLQFINDWQLDRKLFPPNFDPQDYIIDITRAGTLEEFNYSSRTDYFTPNYNDLYNNNIISYLIPSDFPSFRCLALKSNKSGVRRICFIWFFIKTTPKYLCTGEFLSALNSLSLHKFIPRKISDRYILLDNFDKLTKSFEMVTNLRIFLCSSGFSNVHSRSVEKFNEANPDQPIFLVNPNHLSVETQTSIYGKQFLASLSATPKNLNFFSVRTEKVTHTTIDINEFIIPPLSRLLTSLKSSGKIKRDFLTTSNVSASSNNTPQISTKKRRRKPDNPGRIPKRFRFE